MIKRFEKLSTKFEEVAKSVNYNKEELEKLNDSVTDIMSLITTTLVEIEDSTTYDMETTQLIADYSFKKFVSYLEKVGEDLNDQANEPYLKVVMGVCECVSESLEQKGIDLDWITKVSSIADKFMEPIKSGKNISVADFIEEFFDYCTIRKIKPILIIDALALVEIDLEKYNSKNTEITKGKSDNSIKINKITKSIKADVIDSNGYFCGDLNLFNDLAEDNGECDHYVLKKNNEIVGNFSLKEEDDDIINLYVFLSSKNPDIATPYMDKIVEFIRENYDFDKAQIRMNNAGPMGKEGWALTVLNESKHFSVHAKFGMSVWYYGFDSEE